MIAYHKPIDYIMMFYDNKGGTWHQNWYEGRKDYITFDDDITNVGLWYQNGFLLRPFDYTTMLLWKYNVDLWHHNFLWWHIVFIMITQLIMISMTGSW